MNYNHPTIQLGTKLIWIKKDEFAQLIKRIEKDTNYYIHMPTFSGESQWVRNNTTKTVYITPFFGFDKEPKSVNIENLILQ